MTGPPYGASVAPPHPLGDSAPRGTRRRGLAVTSGIAGALMLPGGGVPPEDACSNRRQTISNSAFDTVMWRYEPATRLFPEELGTAGAWPPITPKGSA